MSKTSERLRTGARVHGAIAFALACGLATSGRQARAEGSNPAPPEISIEGAPLDLSHPFALPGAGDALPTNLDQLVAHHVTEVRFDINLREPTSPPPPPGSPPGTPPMSVDQWIQEELGSKSKVLAGLERGPSGNYVNADDQFVKDVQALSKKLGLGTIKPAEAWTEFRLAQYAERLRALNAAGIKAYAILDQNLLPATLEPHSPLRAQAADLSGGLNKAWVGAFGKTVTLVANALSKSPSAWGDVQHFEILNEPNNTITGTSTCWCSPENDGAILDAAWSSIHAVKGVTLPPIASGPLVVDDTWTTAGNSVDQQIDGWTDPNTNPPTKHLGVGGYLKATLESAKRNQGFYNAPVQPPFDEVAFHPYFGGLDPTKQAAYYARYGGLTKYVQTNVTRMTDALDGALSANGYDAANFPLVVSELGVKHFGSGKVQAAIQKDLYDAVVSNKRVRVISFFAPYDFTGANGKTYAYGIWNKQDSVAKLQVDLAYWRQILDEAAAAGENLETMEHAQEQIEQDEALLRETTPGMRRAGKFFVAVSSSAATNALWPSAEGAAPGAAPAPSSSAATSPAAASPPGSATSSPGAEADPTTSSAGFVGGLSPVNPGGR